MSTFLSKLVPRKEESNTILFREMDDIPSVFFFIKG